MGEAIYKICARSAWDQAVSCGVYQGSPDDERDGFIHFSRAHQVAGTQAKYFRGKRDLVLVSVDADRLGPPLRFEASRGGDDFPHLYGSLETMYALSVTPIIPLEEAPLLENPERVWSTDEPARAVDRTLVEARIGPCSETLEILGGGLANLNIWLRESGRVLRIHRRDPTTATKETRLLERPWKSFRVPKALASGADFSLLEYVPHIALRDAVSVGGLVGRALAEIHSHHYEHQGFLDGSLRVSTRFADPIESLVEHVRSLAPRSRDSDASGLYEEVARVLERKRDEVSSLTYSAVLLHGDFKASNLHLTDLPELLVLDWEFAYAGCSLMDIGQLFRWHPSTAFRRAFADAYRACGGVLPLDFERWTGLFDLVNLVDLLSRSRPSSSRFHELEARIEHELREQAI